MRPSDGSFSLWPVGVILFVLLIAIVSTQPKVILNSNAPDDFVTLHVSKEPKAAAAQGYWKVASTVIQWKYSRTAELPQQPPAEFTITGVAKAESIEERGLRAAYWAKLRDEWTKPENWHTTYSFSLNWMVQDLQTLVRGVKGLVNQT